MRKFLGILLVMLGVAGPGWAALGEQESSVTADLQFLKGQIRDETHPGYRLHQITDASGGVVREYVSTGGKVFGVSWQGPFVPNMQQLLGAYYVYLQQYAQSQTSHHGGPLIIQRYDFVFSSAGHMGARRGRAYVPGLLPASLTPEVVQ